MVRTHRASGKVEISRIFGRQATFAAWLLLGAIIAIFLLGGGSRGDIRSLLLLRPLSILLLGFGLYVAAGTAWTKHRGLTLAIASLVILHILQLVPLPPEIWARLAGRSGLAADLSVAGIKNDWRPLSLVPFQTWGSLFSLAAPIAVLLLAISLPSRFDQARMVGLCVVLATASAIFGFLQVVSGYSSALYVYDVTNNGVAVGLFANRNHNGVFLATAIPMMAYLAGQAQRVGFPPRYTLGTLFVFIFAMMLGVVISGSRSGVALLILGLMTVPLLADLPKVRAGASLHGLLFAIGLAAILLVFIIVFNPTNALSRFLTIDLVDDLRFEIWPIAWREVWTYFPWGSGFGTFVEAYQIAEPSEVLRTKYVNHAHNDWLELLMDSGLVGGVMIIAALGTWVMRLAHAIRAEEVNRLQILGLIVTAMLGLASFFDYPLRVPALASLFALGVTWAFIPKAEEGARHKKPRSRQAISLGVTS